MSERQPVFFLSHGAPPLADDATWTRQLHDWSSRVAKPKNVLMVSAHWENQPVTVSSTRPGTPLVYDFWGFPQKYYEVTYDAPVAPETARPRKGSQGRSSTGPAHRPSPPAGRSRSPHPASRGRSPRHRP